jgi:serine/threonine protein kinase
MEVAAPGLKNLYILTGLRGHSYLLLITMELSDLPQGRLEKHESAADRESLGGSVSLYVRLWSYGGPSQPLTGLALDHDHEVPQLIRGIVGDGKGQVAEQRPELLTARFDSPLQALSTARELQQRFLTFQRKTEPQQVVPSILISATKKEAASDADPSTTQAIPGQMLLNGTSAQILVSEPVYELVKAAPGFKFNPKPVRESGGTGGPEAIYELLWTDESTYGHLRQAGSSGGFRTVGRYQIQEELGRGAMGVVYKAYDQLIGRTIALKTIEINRTTPDRDDLIERLKQEAKAAGGLDHPNIITIYDVGQDADLIYLSMQFLEGKTLLTVMAESPLPTLPTLFSYADQICSAVGFAHARGVIHRDLKPANLMLTNQGVIKVLDFGIAKLENASLTQTGLVVGTPSHMAPEQVAGKKIDHRADIFALGSVFYELVTREKPFRGDVTTILYKIMHEDPVAPSLINPALPGGVDAIIRKALAKDPNERFQSCEEMREAFLEQATLLNVTPAVTAAPAVAVVAKPGPRTPPAFPHYLLEETKPKRSARNWLGVAAAVLLVIIGVTDWAFYTKSHTGSFPLVIAKVVGAFHRNPAPGSGSETAQESVAPASGDTDQNGSTGDPGNAGAMNSKAKPSAAENNRTLPAQSAADNAGTPGASQQPATVTASSGSQPASDKSQQISDASHTAAVTTSAPAGAAQTQTVSASQAAAGQPLDKDKSQPTTASNVAASNADPAKSAQASDSEENSAPVKPVKKAPPLPQTVDGFTRRDIPELLRQADTAAGRADYKLARYEYALILKLDPGNAAARTALRRIQAAAQDQIR